MTKKRAKDAQPFLEEAYSLGRTGNILTNNFRILLSLFKKTNIEAPITYNSEQLDNVVDMFNPDMALAIAVDPNTGEILGMSSRPNYDPNNYKKYTMEQLSRNLPIWASYEPGSTFKNVTPLLSHKILYL